VRGNEDVAIGLPAAQLRSIRAGSASGASRQASHNPPVVGPSPTRPHRLVTSSSYPAGPGVPWCPPGRTLLIPSPPVDERVRPLGRIVWTGRTCSPRSLSGRAPRPAPPCPAPSPSAPTPAASRPADATPTRPGCTAPTPNGPARSAARPSPAGSPPPSSPNTSPCSTTPGNSAPCSPNSRTSLCRSSKQAARSSSRTQNRRTAVRKTWAEPA
jgi:hypothetical protein